MASSGSFNTGAYEVRYLTFAWSVASQSVQNNQTVINYSLTGAGSNGSYWYYVQNVTLIINGVQVYRLPKSTQIKLKAGTVLASGQLTINHNDLGDKVFSASCTAGIYEHDPNVSGSGSWALPDIPRYANITNFSLASETETTLAWNWSTDKECTAVYYDLYTTDGVFIKSENVGTGSSGGFTITDLASGTFYKVRLRCVANGLENASAMVDINTYNYPHASSLPDFQIGDAVTIGLFNPLGHPVTVEMLANNIVVDSLETSGTSVTGFDSYAAFNRLYQSIPNARSASYIIRVTYDTSIHEPILTQGGIYSVNPEICKPALPNVYYDDINDTAYAITGDRKKIVRSISTVHYRASIRALQWSNIASVTVDVNGDTYDLTLLTNLDAAGGDASIDSGTDVTAVFTVTDTRGFTNQKSITVTMIDWQPPSAVITAQRHDNFYSETDLKADAEYTQIGSNAVTITYAATKDGDSSPSVSGTLTDNVTSVVTLDNNYGWSVRITVTDSFGGSKVYTIVISRGMPIIYFDRIKSSVGINCFPTEDQSLEVDGLVIINGKKLVFGTGGTVTWEAV